MKNKLLALLLILCMLVPGASFAEEYYDPDNTVYCGTVEDFTTYVLNITTCLVDSFRIDYSPEAAWIFADWDNVHTVFYNNGMKNWKATRYSDHLIVNDIEYMAGFRMLWGSYMDDARYIYNDEEAAALRNAQEIVRAAKGSCSTELELERYFHDYLCRETVYVETDEGTVFDEATGPLYYGKAECDGYADAFYLLCSLAGLQVGFQHGTTDGYEGTHLWNIINIGDCWMHVDVTWDDLEYEQCPEYCSKYLYFNTSGEMLTTHHWDSRFSFWSLYPHTNWDYFFYTCSQSGQENMGSYFGDDIKAAANFVKQQKKAGRPSAHFMIDGNYSDGKWINQKLQDYGLSGRWITWTSSASKYTCFDVYFER